METEESRKWAESKLKTLAGGDRISTRFMRQDFFEYTPQYGGMGAMVANCPLDLPSEKARTSTFVQPTVREFASLQLEDFSWHPAANLYCSVLIREAGNYVGHSPRPWASDLVGFCTLAHASGLKTMIPTKSK